MFLFGYNSVNQYIMTQPLESMFYRIIDKTGIQTCLPCQRACKVRSTKGLLVHFLGRVAAAFIKII
jgi:hypothetical protein